MAPLLCGTCVFTHIAKTVVRLFCWIYLTFVHVTGTTSKFQLLCIKLRFICAISFAKTKFAFLNNLMLEINFPTSSRKLAFICGALRDLVPFVQFKKREKHPWRSVNFNKVAGSTLFKGDNSELDCRFLEFCS